MTAQLTGVLRARAARVATAPPRRPTTVLYGGANRFHEQTPKKLGRMARAAFERWTPDAIRLAHAMGFAGAGAFPRDAASIDVLLRETSTSKAYPTLAFAREIHARMLHKLDVEPIEDFRIDFEDGLGPISDDDEDRLATRVGTFAAMCVARGEAPPFFGLRPKAVANAQGPARASQTLHLFFRAYATELSLVDATPHPAMVVTLPKVEDPTEVAIAAAILDAIEAETGLGPIALEVMVESARGLFDDTGALRVPALIDAGAGRVKGVHFGTYYYSASVGIAAPAQRADHPACELARQLLQAACVPLGVVVSDGATHEIPLGPHRGEELPAALEEENRVVVEEALRLHASNIHRALHSGIDLGWDLHPTQLLARYAATYAFYRRPLAAMTSRMKGYCDRAAEAALSGAMFDDAASASGVLVFFLRGLDCGALDVAELYAAGLNDAVIAARTMAPLVDAAPTP